MGYVLTEHDVAVLANLPGMDHAALGLDVAPDEHLGVELSKLSYHLAVSRLDLPGGQVDGDPVFPNSLGKPCRPRSAQLMRSDLKSAKCPTTFKGHPITFHALRRTFATWLEEAGVHPLTKKCLLGHAFLSVDEKHYSESSMEARLSAIRSIVLDVSSEELLAAGGGRR